MMPGRRLGFALLAMTTSQAAVYVARPTTSYRLLALGSGSQAVGLVTAAFALLPLVFAIPLGRASDARRVPLITIGCCLEIGACALLATLRTPVGLGVASALLGLGHLGVALGVQDVIARGSDDTHHDRHFGLLTAGVSLGQLLGPLAGGAIIGHATGSALEGATTRAMLAAAGFAAVAAAFGAFGERGVARPEVEPAAARGSVRSILVLPGVPVGLFASIAVLSAADVFTAYLPVLAEERSITPAAVGVLLAVRAGATVAARLGIGWLVEAMGRGRLIATGALASAVGLAAMTQADHVLLLGLLAVLVGAGLGYGQPLSMTLIVQRVPMHARATALAVRLTGNRCGQVAAPAAAGALAGTAGAGAVFWMLSGLLVVTAAATCRSG